MGGKVWREYCWEELRLRAYDLRFLDHRPKRSVDMRKDISDKLIHFTKSRDGATAFEVLIEILDSGSLIASDSLIKGGYSCVCFTEAPIEALKLGFRNWRGSSKYEGFGAMFSKRWVFERGGRPVIYQPDEEFGALSEQHRWRHVRYEPLREPPVDFTWEREWRVQCFDLMFEASSVVVVAPDYTWAKQFDSRYGEYTIERYGELMDDDELEYHAFGGPTPWRIVALNEPAMVF
jgi:hypothetical protein